MSNIIETAIAANSFKTLMAVVKVTGLAEILSGPGPFTFFAPNDEAFAKLPKADLEGLLKNTPKLKQLLAYHVVEGQMMGADVAKLATSQTLEGQNVGIATNKGVKVMTRK